MPGLACNACNAEFPDETVQKAHYRTDWHRYNLKRKVAGVPGVTEGLFNLRLEALAAEKKKAEGERLLYKCSLCGKEYSTEKAHRQHLQSKLHISKASELEDSSRAGLAVIRPAPARPVKEEQPKAERREEEDEESDEDWEEVDSDEVDDAVMELRTDEDGPDRASSSGEVMDEEWDASRCFICDLQPDGSIESCVEHMHKVHGFFIPDAEYLKDIQGMLSYLGLKVTKGHMCLFCDDRGKRFLSLEAVRKHMISKSHCKLRYGDGEGAAEEELEDFYDFSSSYVSPDGMQLIKVEDGENAPAVLTSGGLELMLKGDETEGKASKTIGSRELFRYYKQKPKPSDQRDGMVVNAVIARYRSMGLATREATPRYHKSADGKKTRASRLEYMRTQVGMRNNVNWDLPRNVPY
ncbi:hypothetical protein R1flu_004510 [Riccia fluitans]|uniref:C2H2-type domain-containing protein n=1 Tax=Riccia fluitans TaxID=41844 RepID=A0ABD1YQH5_9MARC